MNEAHEDMQDSPLRRGKDSKKKPRYVMFFVKPITMFVFNFWFTKNAHSSLNFQVWTAFNQS